MISPSSGIPRLKSALPNGGAMISGSSTVPAQSI